jgi:hypothetical protein
VPTEQVLAGGLVRDEWAVVGQALVEEERLRVQRTWLRGIATGRDALILAFAAPGQALEPGVVAGTRVEASLAFYPGAVPLRALVAERHGESLALARLPGYETIDQALAARARTLAGNPWLDRFPVALCGAVPGRTGEGWALVDRDGQALSLPARYEGAWRLAALSGGHPVDAFGELERDELTPLTAIADGRLVAL